MRVRILKNLCGPGIDYRVGQVVNIASPAGIIAGGDAIAEGPAPSGAIGTLYRGAGYIELTPDPSGYIGPSGHIADAPSGGGFYCTDDYTITVVFPGKRATTFNIMAMRPPLS